MCGINRNERRQIGINLIGKNAAIKSSDVFLHMALIDYIDSSRRGVRHRQLRGRSLPVAAATFAELMLKSMQSAKAGV
jgi:hypothetical protein